MSRSIKRFLKNTRGAFAMQFALLAVPLTVCTGLAIDGGRAFLARFELASALDAAALAVGSTIQEGADLDAIAAKFVNRNFRTEHDDPIDLELVPGEDTIVLKGTVKINTYFMPLIGQPTVTVSAESEVRRGGSNVEVALALDITGSMNATRIAGLKSAATLLINEVVNPVQTPFFSKVAIVPWSQSVNLSTGVSHVPSGSVTELRGTPTPSRSISGASWRNGGATTRTISTAGWRVGTGTDIDNITWRNGSSRTVSSISKSSGRIRVNFSSAHGYSNGDTVLITDASAPYDFLNGNRYKVADRTTTSPYRFQLQEVGTTTYVTAPASTSTSTTGTSQRCFSTTCEMAVNAVDSNFATGDFVYIDDVDTMGGGASPNLSWGNTYTVAAYNADWFVLPGTNATTFATYSNNGVASKCYVSDCRYRVTTSTNHNFATSDHIFIWGLSETGSGTSIISATNTTWSVNNPATNVFYMPGQGWTYADWVSGGSVAECALASCNTQITTSSSHGLSSGERVEIKSASGMTGINTCSLSSSGTCSSGSRLAWEVGTVDGNIYTLVDTSPALPNMSGTYTSSGTSQCTTYGCNRFWFLTSGGAERLYRPSQCLVERYGDDAVTDVAPGTSPLGILYTGNAACDQVNYVTPLTADKTRLADAIAALDTGGSTAGQLGVGWGWYMLSPNFGTVWDKEADNVPKDYTYSELAKILILMTDGEFNYATCNGVSASSISTSQCVPNDAGDNTAGKHVAFKQAEAMCAAMKSQDIIIYAVGLELDTSLYSDDFLSKCATSPEHTFLAADTAELEDAFRDIAISISKLRIAR